MTTQPSLFPPEPQPVVETESTQTYHSDAIKFLRSLPDNHADMLCTDPPYYSPAKVSATRTDFRRDFGEYGILQFFIGEMAKEVERVLTPDGVLYLFCNSTTYPLFYYGFYPITKHLRALVWDKRKAFMGYAWRHQHEFIMFGQMPHAPVIKTGDGDVLQFPAVAVGDRTHPAEKPVALLRKLIAKHSPKRVIDPFMGTGSTMKAAEEEGVAFVGCDSSLDYLKVAEGRLA